MSREIRFPAAAVAAIAKGNRIEAIKLVREANHGVDLRGAMEAVEAHAAGRQVFPVDPPPPVSSIGRSSALPPEAMAALARGQMIDAIKIARETLGLGLKEAKDLVESHRVQRQAPSLTQGGDKLENLARKHGLEISPAAEAALNRGNLLEAFKLVRQENRIGLQQARDLVRGQAGASIPNAARRASTVSTETNRHGWLWALLLLMGVAAAWVLLTR